MSGELNREVEKGGIKSDHLQDIVCLAESQWWRGATSSAHLSHVAYVLAITCGSVARGFYLDRLDLGTNGEKKHGITILQTKGWQCGGTVGHWGRHALGKGKGK